VQRAMWREGVGAVAVALLFDELVDASHTKAAGRRPPGSRSHLYRTELRISASQAE
jgi:hypothetical protein